MGYEQLNMLQEVEGVKPLNNTNYTYKSPSLIASSYELSFTQQRIISLGCKKIQPIYIEKRITPNDLTKVLGAMQFSLIEISVSEYKKEYNIVGNNIYDYLKKETDDLYEQGFFYFDEHNKLCKRRWVSSIDFDRDNGNISITFNIDIILDLLIFKGKFVALFFDMSQDVRSKYAFRIYEILKSKSYLGKYKVSVEEFKFMLAITDKYEDFANLNKKVIKPNLKVINQYSDIEVEYSQTRSGRNVKWLEFNISKKLNTTFVPDNDFKNKIPSAFKEVSEVLDKYNIELTSGEAEILFDLAIKVTKEKYPNVDPVTYIKNKVSVLDTYVKNNDLDSPMGFLISAIKGEYKSNSIPKQPKQTGFNNFEAREMYSDEEKMKSLENRLLGWDDGYEEVAIEDVTK